MTADEMFEELYYTKYEEKYCDRYTYHESYIRVDILFIFENKSVTISMYDEKKNIYYSTELCIEELKAINKKVEELGW